MKRDATKVKACKQCKAEFHPTPLDRLFCSDKCRLRWVKDWLRSPEIVAQVDGGQRNRGGMPSDTSQTSLGDLAANA